MTAETVLYILVSGVVLGSLYALMAVGLALVWTTLGIFNFAHGTFITLGAYFAWTVADGNGLGWGLAAGIAFSVAALAALGCLAEAVLVRPFLKRDNLVLVAVITTLAAATFLENATLLSWGGRSKQLAPLAEGNISMFGIGLSAHEAAIVVIAPLILYSVWLFLQRTRTGSALRAIAQNQEAALLAGIPVARLYALSFALAASLAGLVGIFLGGIKFMSPSMGTDPMVKALVVVIFGGIASISGPIRAAYVIGLLEAVCIYSIGIYWTQAVLFLVMIAVLMIRPTGLFGGQRA
jgi:branched-chain amino acid transport system permease protein